MTWVHWSHINPNKCNCEGWGWTEDEEHCAMHGFVVEDGVLVPVDKGNEEHRKKQYRYAWMAYQKSSGLSPAVFCSRVEDRATNQTMQALLDACEEISNGTV
tara:strand:+ start:1675 stop:1980 length:306 start_codon:yes stop_codon:yes gene_type:complete